MASFIFWRLARTFLAIWALASAVFLLSRHDLDTALRLALPEPELCIWQVDHSKSKVYSVENGFFQDAELVDAGYKYAEANVRTAALQSGILAQTTLNAEQILRPMLETMTGRRVILTHQMQNPQLPDKR